MPGHEKVFVVCENKCFEEGMTKEQIQNAITSGAGGVIDPVTGVKYEFRVLTKRQYDELIEPDPNIIYYVVGDDDKVKIIEFSSQSNIELYDKTESPAIKSIDLTNDLDNTDIILGISCNLHIKCDTTSNGTVQHFQGNLPIYGIFNSIEDKYFSVNQIVVLTRNDTGVDPNADGRLFYVDFRIGIEEVNNRTVIHLDNVSVKNIVFGIGTQIGLDDTAWGNQVIELSSERSVTLLLN